MFCTTLILTCRVCYLTPHLFPILAAIILAATALGFNTQRTYAMKILENAWSSFLADLTKDKKPHTVGVVVLAWSCVIKSILKSVFHEKVQALDYGLGSRGSWIVVT
ncbi:hypothetical protein BDR03DRAFT_880179 [Suillus americanus]|nr:hypothetical protein BDR03DRAFT_880179 [Suillus americanus]